MARLRYHRAVLRFIAYAVPLLILLLALFGFTVELLDAEPKKGSVIRLALFEQPRVPGQLVIGTWLVEASGLIALFLLAQGRFGAWWLDGLVAGWVAWVFRGPLLVITIVVAARQPQDPWWKLAFGWWVLYSICGLSLAILARRSGLGAWTSESEAPEPEPATEPRAESTEPTPETVTEDTDSEDVEREPVEPEAPEAQPEYPEEQPEAPEAQPEPQPEATESAVEPPTSEPQPEEASPGQGSASKTADLANPDSTHSKD